MSGNASPMVTPTNPEGFSSQARIMRFFMPVSENIVVAMESLKTNLKNRFAEAEASLETLERNNQQLQELVIRTASDLPALYQNTIGDVEKFKNLVAQEKDELHGKGDTQKGKSLLSEYEEISKDCASAVEKNAISKTEREALEKRIADLNNKINQKIEKQNQIKEQQALAAKRFAQEANNSGIPVQVPKLN